MMLSFLSFMLLLLPHALADRVIVDIYLGYTGNYVSKAIICFGSNGFNYPLGSWGDGYSAETLLGAMQLADDGECNIWNIGNGWDLGYDTFGQSAFTAVVCGGLSNKAGYGEILDRRIQCADDQVLVMWYQQSNYRDRIYNLVQGNWVRKPGESDNESVSGVTVADQIMANVIISPENSVCTIEYSKATCHPPGWSTPGPTTAPPTTAPPTTAPPTTAPPANGGGDGGTTNGGGDTSTGGDSSSGGDTINQGDSTIVGDTIHNNIIKEDDEEKGCGPECMGAIASVASAGVAFLGLFVGRKYYWKKNSDSNEDQEEEGSSAGQSRLSRIVPFGGHTNNKKDKDPPPEQHPESTPMAVGVLLTDEEVETDEEEEKPKKKKKKKKKSIVAVDGAVPDSPAAQANDSGEPHEDAVNEDSTLASEPKDAPIPEGLASPSTSPTKKKKKKKKSIHKAHDPSEELASEEMDESSPLPLDGTSPTKKKKKKKRLSTEEGGISTTTKKKHTKKRSSSKVVVTNIEDPIDPEAPKDTGAVSDGSDGHNEAEVV